MIYKDIINNWIISFSSTMSRAGAGITTAIIFLLSVCGCQGKDAGITIPGSRPDFIVATINGRPITEREVANEIAPQVKRLRMEIYKLKSAGLEQLIEKKLIEEAAGKEGKSTDEYLNDYYKENIKEPADEEIKKYYDFRKKQMSDKRLEEVRNTIADFLKANQKNVLKRRLINKLRAGANIKINLKPPRVELEAGDSPAIGKNGAPVTVIEFSDYQHQACGRVRPTVKQIIETYPDKILYTFKDFPSSFHKNSQKAHEAARCAGEHGKYWEMSDELFANQNNLDIQNLKKYAKKIGLDIQKFETCLDEGRYANSVVKNVEEGIAVGVAVTPTFFVNGIMISGAQPFAVFKEIIDSELGEER